MIYYVTYASVKSIIIHESLIVLWPSGTKSRQVTRRNDHAYVETDHQKLIAVVLVGKKGTLNGEFKPLYPWYSTMYHVYKWQII